MNQNQHTCTCTKFNVSHVVKHTRKGHTEYYRIIHSYMYIHKNNNNGYTTILLYTYMYIYMFY